MRLRLLEEESRLLSLKDKENNDETGERLRQVYEKLELIGAGAAVGRCVERARRTPYVTFGPRASCWCGRPYHWLAVV